MSTCKRVLYSGRVQGVGFRYTALGIARNHKVVGTVRNCSDGRVELVVQGESEEVQEFLAAVARQMEGYITEQAVQDTALVDIQGFQIIR